MIFTSITPWPIKILTSCSFLPENATYKSINWWKTEPDWSVIKVGQSIIACHTWPDKNCIIRMPTIHHAPVNMQELSSNIINSVHCQFIRISISKILYDCWAAHNSWAKIKVQGTDHISIIPLYNIKEARLLFYTVKHQFHQVSGQLKCSIMAICGKQVD